ncbi:MAG: tRNA lysidine(34) synthetase TilS [Muribaculaceae bacterium]|nr:tRNA lysidine(34) synthetase TilS [Muribaculaceae bacterium]
MQKNKDTDLTVKFETAVESFLSSRAITRVIVGVSGGADSVALLRALKNISIEIKAVHCNFHLRGEESDRDCRFVEGLCREQNIDLEVVDFDVETYRRANGGSVEMACRELRYAFFEEKRRSEGADRIAVAHNSDDNAETLLLNLFRGAGIVGLRAMRPDTGSVIRPLLEVSRKEIEAYLEALQQPFIIDSSNLSSDYRRNFLRNEVIPLIEREWPAVKDSLNKTASIMRIEEEGINGFTSAILDKSVISYGRLLNPESGKWLLRRYVISKGGTDEIVEEIWASLTKGKIRKGARWNGCKGEFIFGPIGLEWIEGFPLPDGTDISEEFEWVRFRGDQALMEEIRKDRSNRYLWVPDDPSRVFIRTRMDGDRMKPLGMKGSKLVSDIISDSGLTAQHKRGLAVAGYIDSGEILWVENLRRSSKHLITNGDEYVWRLGRKENSKKLGK